MQSFIVLPYKVTLFSKDGEGGIHSILLSHGKPKESKYSLQLSMIR